MKLNHIAAAAFGALAAFSVSAAEADSVAKGSVIFNGTVKASACKVFSTDKEKNLVELGEIGAGALRHGDHSLEKPFRINLSECSNKTIAVMKLDDANAKVGSKSAKDLQLSSDSTAKGVGVQITAAGNVVAFDNEASRTIKINNGQAFDGASGVDFKAWMIASDTSAVTPGTVHAQMDYTIEYK